MTVSELIALLQQRSPDDKVNVEGYEENIPKSTLWLTVSPVYDDDDAEDTVPCLKCGGLIWAGSAKNIQLCFSCLESATRPLVPYTEVFGA